MAMGLRWFMYGNFLVCDDVSALIPIELNANFTPCSCKLGPKSGYHSRKDILSIRDPGLRNSGQELRWQARILLVGPITILMAVIAGSG
jgi:hypothetical protein